MNVPAEQHSNSTSPAELTVPTIGQTVAWMVVMHKHGWEWVKMHGNDSWRWTRGHGVIHSTTAGSWAEWLEFSPSQRSFTGDTLTFSVQTSWNWVKFDLQWTTFELHSGNALPYLYPIFYMLFCILYSFSIPYSYSVSYIPSLYPIAILYPIFLLYTLYLFYIQYSICCILLHVSNIYAHVLFLYSTSYILFHFQYSISNI